MSYDSRCYDLAALFLSDSPEKDTEANRDELAQHIQTEIEGWIGFILKPKDSFEDFAEKEEAKQIGRDALKAAGLPNSDTKPHPHLP